MNTKNIKATASPMPGCPAWTVAVFKAEDVPEGTEVVPAAPVQPVAVPDGEVISDYDMKKVKALKHEFIESMIRSGVQYRTCGAISSILNKVIESNAAPAAQGDAKELTVEDLYRIYRDSYGKLNCEVDPFDTLDETDKQGWRNMAAAIAAKAAA